MQQPDFKTMPKHFMVCFSNSCPLRDDCLRSIVARSNRHTDEILVAVNPALCEGKTCRHYRPNRTTTMAYGMVDSFHEVKADDISALRETLISHFGKGSYYLRRNGRRPITPKEQAYISSVFKRFGYQVAFDRLEEETEWI